MARIGLRAPSAVEEQEENRRRADARGVPAEIMMPRLVMVVSTFLLVLLGLVMVFSASMVEAIDQGSSIFSYVGKQLVFASGGAVVAYGAYRIPYHSWLGKLFFPAWLVCMLLLVAVLLFGTEILGAKRWIYIGGFSLQPSEFAKIALVVGSARIVYEYTSGQIPLRESIRNGLGFVLLPLAFLFFTQSDMGTSMVIGMGILAVLWMADVPAKMVGGIIAAAVAVMAFFMTSGYRAARMAVWLDPWSDAYDTGYQLVRSFYAFSEGGIIGVGLGNSKEKFLHLPEAETDFIFSIVGEELGLIGCIAVIALFLVLLVSGLRIASAAPDSFGVTMAAGLTVMLVGQAFLNMACATGLFPTTGKPLPFVSSGGSSMLASLIMVGLILSVSRGSNVLTTHERRRNDLSVLRVERSEDGGRPAVRSSRRSVERVESLRPREVSRVDGPPRRRSSRPASRDGLMPSSRTRRRSDLNLATGRDRSYFDENNSGRTARRSERPRRSRR